MAKVTIKHCPLPAAGSQTTIAARKIIGLGVIEEHGALVLAGQDNDPHRLYLWVEDDEESTIQIVVLPDNTSFDDEQIEHVYSFMAGPQMFHIYKLRPEYMNTELERLTQQANGEPDEQG